MTPTQSTFASYEKYTIPSYDQGIIAKMLKRSDCTSEDDCLYCGMDIMDVRKYAKQVSNYCYNVVQKTIKKFGNARVYAVVQFKCYDTSCQPTNYDDYTVILVDPSEFISTQNLGRIDITNFQDFQNYLMSGILKEFNSINEQDYVICYGFGEIV